LRSATSPSCRLIEQEESLTILDHHRITCSAKSCIRNHDVNRLVRRGRYGRLEQGQLILPCSNIALNCNSFFDSQLCNDSLDFFFVNIAQRDEGPGKSALVIQIADFNTHPAFTKASA
jgi:hypothetical protein